MPTTATSFRQRQACAQTPRPTRHSVAIAQAGVATGLVSVALKPFWFSCPRAYDVGADESRRGRPDAYSHIAFSFSIAGFECCRW